MKTKMYLLLAVFTLTTISGAVAQQTNEKPKKYTISVEEKAKKETEKMKRELSLTEKQATEINEINLKYAQQRKNELDKLRAKGKTSNSTLTEAEHQKLKEELKLQGELRSGEVRKILNEPQLQKYAKKHDKMEKSKKQKNKKSKKVAILSDFE